MKDRYGDELRLAHIRDAINNIFNFFDGLKEEDFISVKLICSATIYEFIVIGEASKHVSASIKEKYPDVPWNFAYLTRTN
jgi:uncharacterized protein with HEPN domain